MSQSHLPSDNAQLSARKDPLRLAELRRLLILDSTAERVYDDMTLLLSNSLDVPIAMINMLDDERDWLKSSVGLPNRQMSADKSFCNLFFSSSVDLVVIEDATQDARLATHPFVVGAPHVRFYAAVRLKVGGHTVGTLCVRDQKPRRISTEQILQMQTLANAVVDLLSERAGSSAVSLEFMARFGTVHENGVARSRPAGRVA